MKNNIKMRKVFFLLSFFAFLLHADATTTAPSVLRDTMPIIGVNANTFETATYDDSLKMQVHNQRGTGANATKRVLKQLPVLSIVNRAVSLANYSASQTYKTIGGYNADTAGNYAKYRAGLQTAAKAAADSALLANNINSSLSQMAAETTRAMAAEATKANISDIGKASANYYYVNRRTDVTAAQQDALAVRGSTASTFRNIYLARNAAITDLRSGTITSAVVYTVFGNNVKIAEDTSTRTDIDYRVPVGTAANKFYAAYDSDSTSTRTANLGFANLFYIFEDNTKIENYCSSQSRLCDDNISSVNGMSNFGFQNLDYESFYGQSYTGSNTKRSDEMNVNDKSKNVILRFKNYICRRQITPLGGTGNPTFEVTGKFYHKTFQGENNMLDSVYAIKTFAVGDYKIGGDYNSDTTMSVNDIWGGNRYYNLNNATVNWSAKTMKNADGSNTFGIFGLYGLTIKNSVLNFNIGSYEQRFQRAFNHLNAGFAKNAAMFAFGGAQTTNKYSVNINIGVLKSEMKFIGQGWGDSTDSLTCNVNVTDAQFDATYNGSTNLADRYIVNLNLFNKASVINIKGNYTCKGYAGMFLIDGGTGTIILDGVFKTLDDKPVVTVTNAFTGKLIINGQLIVGRDVASPSAASITGTGTAIIQSAISNKAATATILGNSISVNTAFK